MEAAVASSVALDNLLKLYPETWLRNPCKSAGFTPKFGSNAHVSQYELYKSHRTAASVWNEWFGTHHFDASNNAKCFPGGIDELEKKHKNQWQNHHSIAQAKSFSRVKLTVANIQHFINSTQINASIVSANMVANLLKNNISSVTKIYSFLKLFFCQWNMYCWTPKRRSGTKCHIK